MHRSQPFRSGGPGLSQNTPHKRSTESNEAAWLTGETISALGRFH